MKKYRVTLLVSQVSVIEAADDQSAHNQVKNMMLHARLQPDQVPPIVHSIVEIERDEKDRFGPAA